MTGGEDQRGLVRAMLDIRAERRSGVLTVRSDDISTVIVFEGGEPIDAKEEGIPGEPLGRLLVRTHVITSEQNTKVIDAMASATGADKALKFGEQAVKLGILTTEKLQAALRDQIEWRIVRALQRDSASSTFAYTVKEPSAASEPLPLDAIILDAARWWPIEWKRLFLEGRIGHYIAVPAGKHDEVARRFGMTPEERNALVALDGGATAEDLIELGLTAEAEVDLSAIVVALVVTGAAEVTEKPSDTSVMPRQSVLRKSSPGVSASNARAARALSRVKKARATLPSAPPAERRPENERDSRVLAEQWFQHGLAHLRANRLQQAVPLFRRAFGLMPRNLEFELYAMWTEIRVHEQKPNPAQLKILRQIAVAAIRQNPNFGFAYYVLGHVMLAEGQEVMAKHQFAQAVRLDPEAIDAERNVRVLKLNTKKTRIAQVRQSRPAIPAKPSKLPNGNIVGRVALKKSAPAALPTPVVEEQAPPAETATLYAKVEKTLEMPRALTPKPFKAPTEETPEPAKAEAKTDVALSDAPKTSKPPAEGRPSPLPQGPSSLTAVAKRTDDSKSPPPDKAPEEPAAPAATVRTPRTKAAQSKAGLYAGAAMIIGILVAAFAMFGMRAGQPASNPPATIALAPPNNPSPVPAIAASSAAPSVVVAPPVASAPVASASVTSMPSSAPASASAAPSTVPTPVASVAPTSGDGEIKLPSYARERRIYVDGRLVGGGLDKLTTSCGAHEVRIGSSGKSRSIQVPCGGSVEW